MPARLLAPSLGAINACSVEGEESPYLQPHELVALVGFRYLHSFRDFHGDQEIPFPSPRSLLADTHVYGTLVGMTYQATKRFSFSLEIPIQEGVRETYYEHDFIGLKTFAAMRAGGIGDIKLIANAWLLDPDKYRTGNISLGLGVKFPNGKNDAKDIAHRPTGPVLRPVNAAIQPGDGTWGIVTEIDAFLKVYKNTYAYLQGTYLINPAENNGVEDTNSDIPDWNLGLDRQYQFNSVPDQYLGRAGLGYVIWPKMGLAVTLGARIEGVPNGDLIGGDLGARIPGHAVYIEPGLSVTKGRWSVTVTGPVAIYRYADPNVSDPQLAKVLGVQYDGLGTAAFADYLITTSLSVRF